MEGLSRDSQIPGLLNTIFRLIALRRNGIQSRPPPFAAKPPRLALTRRNWMVCFHQGAALRGGPSGSRPEAITHYLSEAGFGLIRQNSPTNAIISPMMKMVPMTTVRCLSTDHAVNEAEIESAGSAEKPATRNPKKTQLIRRCGSRQCSVGADIGQEWVDLPIHVIGDIDGDDRRRDAPFEPCEDEIREGTSLRLGSCPASLIAMAREVTETPSATEKDRRVGDQVRIGLAWVDCPAEIAEQKHRQDRHTVNGEGVAYPPCNAGRDPGIKAPLRLPCRRSQLIADSDTPR